MTAKDGIDWSAFAPEKLDDIMLGMMYRIRHSHGDRRPVGERPMDVDHQTGLPLSEAVLARGGHVKSGLQTALETAQHPDKWAGNLILNDQGEALWRVPRQKWTSVESNAIAELTYRFKRRALFWAEKGWIQVKPPVVWESEREPERNAGFKQGYGDDGLPYVWHITPEGLEEAERRIPGTIQAKGPVSALATASQADREHAAKVAEWAHKEWRLEDGAGK